MSSIDWNDKDAFRSHGGNGHATDISGSSRAKLTSKRGGDNCRVEYNDFSAPLPDAELLHLDEALTRLALIKPEHAKLVELRYFAE